MQRPLVVELDTFGMVESVAEVPELVEACEPEDEVAGLDEVLEVALEVDEEEEVELLVEVEPFAEVEVLEEVEVAAFEEVELEVAILPEPCDCPPKGKLLRSVWTEREL